MAIRSITKGRKILENKVRCRKCGTILNSTKTDSTIYCRCGSIWASGGRRKTLRGGEIAFMEDLSKYA